MEEHLSPTEAQKNLLKRTDQGLRLIFELTPQEASIMGLLMSYPIVTPEVMLGRIGMATEVRVAIYRLRKTLKKTSNVEIRSKRLFGYWLDDDTKSHIRKLLVSKMGDGV